MSGQVQLIRLEPDLERTLWSDAELQEAFGQGRWADAGERIQRIIGRTALASARPANQLLWDGYFAADVETRDLVGSCAFKAPPTDEGEVEIAYFTYPSFEGRGYATSMARRLIELASAAPAIRRVVAHTLPTPSASTRVLEKVGMTLVGEVMDPEDGRVWRWQVENSNR